MKNLEKGFKKFSEILKKSKANGEVSGYVLIGGLAVSARARPRATKDIDFLIAAEKKFYEETLPIIVSAQKCTMKVFTSNQLDPLHGLVRIYDSTGQELVDLIPVFWNWQNEIIGHAENIEVFGRSVPVARIEDIIVLKLKAGGPQDMLDVEELFKAAKATHLNKKRLCELAKRARVDKKLAKFLR